MAFKKATLQSKFAQNTATSFSLSPLSLSLLEERLTDLLNVGEQAEHLSYL
jgi:hypothetical protein